MVSLTSRDILEEFQRNALYKLHIAVIPKDTKFIVTVDGKRAVTIETSFKTVVGVRYETSILEAFFKPELIAYLRALKFKELHNWEGVVQN